MSSLLVGIGSFAMLVLASWCVAEGGERLGHRYDASIIGGLVIAWLNTAPETLFLLKALWTENPSFAAGAISGSSIVVSTIALGCSIYFGARKRRNNAIYLKHEVRIQSLALLLSVVVALWIAIGGFNAWVGLLACSEYAVFLWYTLKHSHRRGHSSSSSAATHDHGHAEAHTDVDIESGTGSTTTGFASMLNRFQLLRSDSVQSGLYSASEAEDSSSSEDDEEPLYKGWLYLVAGGLLIILFSDPFIQSVMEGASQLDVSPTLLAFFLAPIASEAPEILESITLSRKGRSQSINIAFSNLVGGTVTKTTLLVGIYSIAGAVWGYRWEVPSFTVCFVMLALSAAFAGAIGFLLRQIRQYVAFWFFGVFVLSAFGQYFVSLYAEHYVDDVVPFVGFKE